MDLAGKNQRLLPSLMPPDAISLLTASDLLPFLILVHLAVGDRVSCVNGDGVCLTKQLLSQLSSELGIQECITRLCISRSCAPENSSSTSVNLLYNGTNPSSMWAGYRRISFIRAIAHAVMIANASCHLEWFPSLPVPGATFRKQGLRYVLFAVLFMLCCPRVDTRMNEKFKNPVCIYPVRHWTLVGLSQALGPKEISSASKAVWN